MKAYQIDSNDVMKKLQTSADRGLSSDFAREQLKRFGSNALPEEGGFSVFTIFLSQFLNPMMFILLIAVGMSVLIGEYKDACIIMLAVVINVVVGFFQEWRAEKAARALKSYEVSYCHVKRDGAVISIDARELVPGDYVLLAAGARVPADVRLVKVTDLTIEEALLTGEAKPIKKTSQAIQEECVVGDRTNMAFAGTYVVSGKAEGVVVTTGKDTELGHIARLVVETKEEETPLQLQIKRFSWVLGGIMLFVTAIVAVIALIKGISFHEVLTLSIALAVASIPEGLLVTVTAILAIGMYRMLRRKALVRHLVAAETLGSVSVVCTDKTGTLTEGSMRVVEIITSKEVIHFAQEKKDMSLSEDLRELLTLCVLNNDVEIAATGEATVGHPTERALVQAAQKAGLPIEKIRADFQRLDEVPFSSDRKYMATLHQWNEKKRLIVKGAPERIFNMCNHDNGNLQHFRDMTEDMTKRGLRLLALAVKDDGISSVDEEITGLTCAGLIGIQDPLRPQAAQTVKELKEAGIRVILVTGDHQETASYIANGVGLATAQEHVMTGERLDKLAPNQLAEKIDTIDVFARVDPRHKIRIVQAWQGKGQAVAMTGDGVNDAPALKAADIGVALGSGSDVSHEISDMVLLDNNLSTITSAVQEGRTIFDNIRKVIAYLMIDSFSEIILILAALLAGLPLPMLAVQIFWINLVTDGFTALALTVEPSEPEIMREPPRRKNEPVVNNEMKFLIFIIGVITDLGLFGLYVLLFYHSSLAFEHIRTIVFTALAVDSLLYVFSVRSFRRSLFRMNPFSNRWLVWAVFAGFIMQCVAVYVPFMQKLLSTVPLSLLDWGVIFGMSLIKILGIEVTKEIFLRNKDSI